MMKIRDNDPLKSKPLPTNSQSVVKFVLIASLIFFGFGFWVMQPRTIQIEFESPAIDSNR